VSARSGRDERGAAVVIGAGAIAVLVFVAMICGGVVAIVLAHRQAQAAADLASLAGAAALQRGGDACGAASGMAGRQHAVVSACRVEGPALSVTAVVELPAALGGGQVAARARAGPASLLPAAGADGALLAEDPGEQ